VKEEEEDSYDISSFINRAPPQMKRPLTVGGLDKKSAESCWKAIKNPIQDGKNNTKSEFNLFILISFSSFSKSIKTKD
jgi:hypothetical protein